MENEHEKKSHLSIFHQLFLEKNGHKRESTIESGTNSVLFKDCRDNETQSLKTGQSLKKRE